MNKAKLKSYAPQARKDFIAAVTARANLLGLSDNNGQLQIAPSQPQGDITLIGGQPWPAKVHGQRQQLIARLQKDGFAQTMEAIAYTWFNRFAALRFMELHDYLGHGQRALSSAAGTLPDILTHAADLAQSGNLPGLKTALVTEMKLAGNRDGELYRMLLVAQCNALSRAMPFLFERIDDDSELLLPDNLLRSDSVIAKLVEAIPEGDWAEVEIIGWLYQFYISEKKDQVIGKVVKSEDIPAATQLFTPNWIVQYLVQNSVGRLWLMANPHSTLAKEWPYYITPAEQTPEVQAQLDALIQTRVREDGDTLNPESITVLDPACGSGHILVVAYDVLKAIYLERGYRVRDIPRLILEKNLFGLDIDDRAAQMAGFALLMKARADDRRLFNEPIKLNVLALQESKGLDADVLTRALQTVLLPLLPGEGGGEGSPRGNDFFDNDLFPGTRPQISLGEDSHALALGEGGGGGALRATITALVDTFEHAKTFGSLIQIPYALKTHLEVLPEVLVKVRQSGDMYATAAADDLLSLVQQAQILAMQFDAVVANPPYMGGKGMNPVLKEFAKTTFPDSKSDLFAMFIGRGFKWCKQTGFNSMVTMQSWMFLSSYAAMREKLLRNRTLSCMVHMGNGVMGIAFGTAATVFWNKHVDKYEGSFSYCEYDDINEDGVPKIFPVQNDRLITAKPDDLTKIPGSPFAYWTGRNTLRVFETSVPLGKDNDIRQGLLTSDNDRFLRLWFEVDFSRIGFGYENRVAAIESKRKWFPINKGGGFRKWYGNLEYVVNWYDDGIELHETIIQKYPYLKGNSGLVLKRTNPYFREATTWTDIAIRLGARYLPQGFLFEKGGSCIFSENAKLTTALLCSNVAMHALSILNSSFHFQVGDVANMPIVNLSQERTSRVEYLAEESIKIAKNDWESFETFWEYSGLFGRGLSDAASLNLAWCRWESQMQEHVKKTQLFEEENNSIFIEAYGLQDELTPEVPESQITLARADREKDCQRLISYAIGCMMGRYSLDEPGLIYAHAGNVGFEPGRYATFPADADGIVPITDELWFADDAPSRIREFLCAVWGQGTLEENMAWLAESLGKKSAKEASETPDETIRRYIADKFFKDHLQTYKKRPIYWLFSSGKQGAFQALVYLHRYHEGTLARLRAEYVVPLTGKIQSRIDMLQKDTAAASSTAARNKLAKEVEKLKKKHVELLAYDEQLRHHADRRITLNLDDGVKVNYGKFGDLLEGVKIITGGASDD